MYNPQRDPNSTTITIKVTHPVIAGMAGNDLTASAEQHNAFT